MRSQATSNGIQKVVGGGIIAAVLVLALAVATTMSASSNTAKQGTPEIRFEPGAINVPEERGLGTWFVGAGFEPNQELIIYVTYGGVRSRVELMMEPAPVADERGAFVVAFPMRPRVAAMLHEDGSGPVSFTAHDAETREPLASTTLLVCDAEENPAPWCNVAVDLVPMD